MDADKYRSRDFLSADLEKDRNQGGRTLNTPLRNVSVKSELIASSFSRISCACSFNADILGPEFC
jgi:hypothetical protein